MNLPIETEQEEDGRWIAEVTTLSGVMIYGPTREQAIARVSVAFHEGQGSPRLPVTDWLDDQAAIRRFSQSARASGLARLRILSA